MLSILIQWSSDTKLIRCIVLFVRTGIRSKFTKVLEMTTYHITMTIMQLAILQGIGSRDMSSFVFKFNDQ